MVEQWGIKLKRKTQGQYLTSWNVTIYNNGKFLQQNTNVIAKPGGACGNLGVRIKALKNKWKFYYEGVWLNDKWYSKYYKRRF